MEKVIAIDPGSEKCGVAVVTETREVITKAIVSRSALFQTITKLMTDYAITILVIGNGTTAKKTVEKLQELKNIYTSLTIHVVDEYRTTDEARKRYWEEHPPQGLRRLIPIGMQVPPVPVDDYAAVILAEKYFIQK